MHAANILRLTLRPPANTDMSRSDILPLVHFIEQLLLLLEGARASTGLCVDVSSGVPPGNNINESNYIHVNPERKFRGTKWRPAERSETGVGRGVEGSSQGIFQKHVLQMVQSQVFLNYICEYN